MNFEIFLRYLLIFLMIIPAVIFACLPVREYLKINSGRWIFISGFFILILISGCAFLASLYSLRVREVLMPVTVLFFIIYFASVKLSLAKKLFCFFNSLMLCAWSNVWAIVLMAPIAMQDILIWYRVRLFTVKSSLICLGISIVSGLIFYRTFTKKLPALLREERLDNAWKYLFLVPLVVAGMLFWMAPINPPLMVIARVRPISLVLITFIIFAVFMLYNIFWRITMNLINSAKLQQENNLLQMEGKRYEELKNYMNESRTLRHDFRQHIAVLSELARAKKINEILSYTEELTQKSAGYVLYCANNAVDAIASHYDNQARANKIKINWRLELPLSLPIKESDFCSMFGNLIENALNAVQNLEEKNKNINVISLMLSEVMLGISIDNPFEGELKFNRSGLPVSKREGHGLGLISVSNIVKRYGGSFKIKTEKNIFRADIILYCQ